MPEIEQLTFDSDLFKEGFTGNHSLTFFLYTNNYSLEEHETVKVEIEVHNLVTPLNYDELQNTNFYRRLKGSIVTTFNEIVIEPEREFKLNDGLEKDTESLMLPTRKQKVIIYAMRLEWKKLYGRNRRRWVKFWEDERYFDVD